MQAAYAKIIAWMETLTPANCTVIVANQNAPTPPRPFVTVKLLTVQDIARDMTPNVRDANDTGEGPFPSADPDFVRDVVRFIQINADVQVYGDPSDIFSAENIAQGFLDHAYNSDAALDILGRDVAFQLVTSGPQSVDGVIGAEFEPRVIMAMQFSATRDIVYQIGGIGGVIIEGDAGDQRVETEVGNTGGQ